MNITFRNASIADIGILKSINLSSFEANASYDPYIDMNWVNTDAATAYFESAVSRASHCVLIAQKDGMPVGYIVVEPKDIPYRTVKIAEIGNMAVLPDSRSLGIGKQLIEKARVWAKSQGYQVLFVNSYFGNEQAVRFYKTCGFAPIDLSLEMPI